MQNLSLQPATIHSEPPDLAKEVARFTALLSERQAELTTLRAEMHEFTLRYAQVVGSRLAELSEVEQAIKDAEARLHAGADMIQNEGEVEEGRAAAGSESSASGKLPVEKHLRKLFWAVAKLFHPDQAANEAEARRRHTTMAEASRAYREGDVDSLHALLGDEALQFYCAAGQADSDSEDLPGRLFTLKEELRTVEFGIKRIKQDSLYRIKLSADEAALAGRNALAAEAERIDRQIVKARHRLTNLI